MKQDGLGGTFNEPRTGETVAAIAHAVQRGQISPRAMVERSLERIDRHEDQIRAFAHLRRDEVLAEAEALAHHPRLSELPMAGVPIAIKDSIDVVGCPTRQGSPATSAASVAKEPPPITRLREAGALIVGKTTTPELCISAVTHSKLSGVTRNPWDPARSPGGSSGGSAAAVSAGMVAAALGTDGGGSVRLPAAACGLIGFKSARGSVPGIDEEAGWYGVTQWGPLTTSVADAAVFYQTLAGAGSTALLEPSSSASGNTIRIGRSDAKPPGVAADPAAINAMNWAADILLDAGHDLSPATVPTQALDSIRALQRAGAGLARDVRNEVSFNKLGPIAKALAVFGSVSRISGEPAISDLTPIEARLRTAFSSHDVLLTPTLAGRQLPADLGYEGGHLGLLRAQTFATTYTAIWNLAGFPAISVPAPLAGDGLPAAVQMVTKPGNETLLFRLAEQLEAKHRWNYPAGYP